MTSLFVADEALVVPHVLCSVSGREIDPVNIHGVGVPCGLSGSGLSWQNVTVPSASEFPESYHVLVELSCLIEPLFPFLASLFLFFGRGGGGHHDSELVGYPSLKGVHRDAIEVNSAVCLGQSEGGGILVEVTVELVHV